MKLVNRTDPQKTQCRICDKIATKKRRIAAEKERLRRWEREGGTLVASIERSRKLIAELERDEAWLKNERDERRSIL